MDKAGTGARRKSSLPEPNTARRTAPFKADMRTNWKSEVRLGVVDSQKAPSTGLRSMAKSG